MGPVVQLDRIADSGSAGWGFESLRDHRKNPENHRKSSKTAATGGFSFTVVYTKIPLVNNFYWQLFSKTLAI